MKTSNGTLVMLNLKDLVLLKENSDYRYRGTKFNALKTSIDSTDQAIRRNEKLNETLNSLVNKTFQNVKKYSSCYT